MHDEQRESLTVEVKGLRNDQGHLLAVLFDGPRGWPRDHAKAVASRKVDIEGDSAAIVFADLQPGTYAIALLHDENDDGKMNTNALGIPKEGFGMSGFEKLKLSVPSFERASFGYEGGAQRIEVRLHYVL